MKNKKLLLLIILTLLLLFTACGKASEKEKKKVNNPPEYISDIAFDNNSDSDNIVYIKEGDKYVPYIVLTDDYYGNALLLRKCVDESHIYNTAGNDYNSYYGESEIDRYLNNEYFDYIERGN